jgi:hypothetical protein
MDGVLNFVQEEMDSRQSSRSSSLPFRRGEERHTRRPTSDCMNAPRVLYASGNAVGDNQERRATSATNAAHVDVQNSWATVAASASLWGEASVAPPACVIR